MSVPQKIVELIPQLTHLQITVIREIMLKRQWQLERNEQCKLENDKKEEGKNDE